MVMGFIAVRRVLRCFELGLADGKGFNQFFGTMLGYQRFLGVDMEEELLYNSSDSLTLEDIWVARKHPSSAGKEPASSSASTSSVMELASLMHDMEVTLLDLGNKQLVSSVLEGVFCLGEGS